MINYATRYAKWPALAKAIKTLRLARIAATAERNATTLYYLERAISAERRLRLALAPELRAHREALARDQAHKARYANLYARRSRTIETAATLRQARQQARAQARQHAIAKRESNRIKNK